MKQIVKPIPKEIASKLGHYVYLLVDPRDESVFYVGKGYKRRCQQHLAKGASKKVRERISAIHAAGKQPRIDILVHDLASDQAALKIEAAAIDLMGLDLLTNQVRGWKTKQFGRMKLEEWIASNGAREISSIEEPTVLCKISRSYRVGMPGIQLYDATRGIWRISPEKRKALKLAFAVYENVVREVYRIEAWMQAGSTFTTREDLAQLDKESRRKWEFVGTVADDAVRKKYIGRNVAKYFTNPRLERAYEAV